MLDVNPAQIEDIDTEIIAPREENHKFQLEQRDANRQVGKDVITNKDQDYQVQIWQNQQILGQMDLISKKINILQHELQKIEKNQQQIIRFQQISNRKQYLGVAEFVPPENRGQKCGCKGYGAQLSTVPAAQSIRSLDVYRLTSISLTKKGYVAIFDDGHYFLYGDDIPSGLIQALEKEQNSKPILVSVGPNDYYFCLFSDYSSKFNAPDSFDDLFEKYKNDQRFLSVAFTENGYVAVHERDGVLWSNEYLAIPHNLYGVLASGYASNVRFVNIGCEGSWFVGYKDGSNKCFLNRFDDGFPFDNNYSFLLDFYGEQYAKWEYYPTTKYLSFKGTEIQQVFFGQDDKFFVYKGLAQREKFKCYG